MDCPDYSRQSKRSARGAIDDDSLDHAINEVNHSMVVTGIVVAAFIAHLLSMQHQQVSKALIGEWRLHDEEPAIQGDHPQNFCTKTEIKKLGARILKKIFFPRKNLQLLKILMKSNLQMSGCGCVVITESGFQNNFVSVLLS